MTYLNRKRKDGKPKPEQIRCRSGVLIDVRDEKLMMKLPALTEREKNINRRKR